MEFLCAVAHVVWFVFIEPWTVWGVVQTYSQLNAVPVCQRDTLNAVRANVTGLGRGRTQKYMGFHYTHEDMTASLSWTLQHDISLLTLSMPFHLFHFGYYHFSVSATKCYSCRHTMDNIYYRYTMIISTTSVVPYAPLMARSQTLSCVAVIFKLNCYSVFIFNNESPHISLCLPLPYLLSLVLYFNVHIWCRFTLMLLYTVCVVYRGSAS